MLHAGQYLADKEFRYLWTVTVTADVYSIEALITCRRRAKDRRNLHLCFC